MDAWILTLLTFFPVIGAILLLVIPRGREQALRWTALAASLITFLLSLALLAGFDRSQPELQMVIRLPWIRIAGWTIEYHLGVDGLSLLLVLLTTFLTPISILSSWTAIQERVKEFMVFFLLLETGMIGVFLAMDLFLL